MRSNVEKKCTGWSFLLSTDYGYWGLMMFDDGVFCLLSINGLPQQAGEYQTAM